MEQSARWRVAVVDPVPAYRRGLVAALQDAGFNAFEDGAQARGLGRGLDALLVTVERSAADVDLEPPRGVRCVVALLQDPSVGAYLEALRCGARSAVAWSGAPELVAQVVEAAISGHALLPAEVAAALARRVPGSAALDVSDEERHWLCVLAEGSTVGQLAAEGRRSERGMHRLLHDLYARMRVTKRSEAIVLAARMGLLDDEVPPQIPRIGRGAANAKRS